MSTAWRCYAHYEYNLPSQPLKRNFTEEELIDTQD